MRLFFCAILCGFSFFHSYHFTEFSNDHLILKYPEDWIVRPIENISKVNLIEETERFSAWSPLKVDEDRKTLELTSPSQLDQKREVSIKKLEKEIWRAAKKELTDAEKISSEEGVKQGVPFIKLVFTYSAGFGHQTKEIYIFSIQNTPYTLYLTSSRKEYLKVQKVWNEVWSNLVFSMNPELNLSIGFTTPS